MTEQLQQPPTVKTRGASAASTASAGKAASGPAVATVNGEPVSSAQFERLLHESHGLFVLDQLIALEVVRQQANQEGVGVSQAEIEWEYDSSVMEMARPMANGSSKTELRRLGEQLLGGFLRDKNISRQEYWLSMQRNAYLRKMLRDEITVTDEQIQAEMDRRFGPKVVARHIVLPDMQTADDILQRLRHGASFRELAQALSTNRSTAAAGGLLPEISRQDPDVPEVIRAVVFDLPVGQVSEVVRVDGQYHLFKVESRTAGQWPADPQPLRDLCRQALLDRTMRQEMQALERKLVKSAQIRIQDPALRKQDDTRRNAAR